MELAIIVIVLGIIGLFVWRSYTVSRQGPPREDHDPESRNTGPSGRRR